MIRRGMMAKGTSYNCTDDTDESLKVDTDELGSTARWGSRDCDRRSISHPLRLFARGIEGRGGCLAAGLGLLAVAVI